MQEEQQRPSRGGLPALAWTSSISFRPLPAFLSLSAGQSDCLSSSDHLPELKSCKSAPPGGGDADFMSFEINGDNSDLGSSAASGVLAQGPDWVGNAEKFNPGGWVRGVAAASSQAKELLKEISVFERARIGAAAGGIAGAFTYACLHPIDTVKTKLQTRGASDVYSGPLDVVLKTFRKQGILGFYSGISAVLVGSTFSSAVYFGTCELGKALLSGVNYFPPLIIPPLAGGMGNLVSSAILVPKEVVTQRMQAGAASRSWEVVFKTIQSEGIGGLYAGYSAALFRNLPASVLSFSSFEYIKAAWLRKSRRKRLEPWQSVISGALAGVISAALTTPLDVVKTRLMTQARHTSLMTVEILGGRAGPTSTKAVIDAEIKAKGTAASYKGISSTLQQIWLEEGWIGLTRGVGPRLLYSACFSALGYFAFETARVELVKRHLAKRKASLASKSRAVSATTTAL